MEGEPTYRSHVRRRYAELQRLFDAGEAVRNVQSQPGWGIVMDLLDMELAHIDARLDGSATLDHVNYAHLHGQRRGLKAAREAASTLVSVYVDALDEQQRKHEADAETPAGR